MNEQEFDELAAGHALNALSAQDEQAYQAALAAHPEWEHIAARYAETTSLLADAVAPVAPPAALRASLLAQLDDVPQTGTDGPTPLVGDADPPDAIAADSDDIGGRAAEPQRGRWPRAWFALAASLALILGVAGISTVVAQSNRAPAQIALEQIEASADAQQASADVAGGGDAVLHWSESVGEAVLVVQSLPAIEADQTFQAWLVRDGTPVSAGTFEPGQASTVALLESGVEPGDIVALTVEQDGGAPEGVPTTDPILAIETA